MKCILSSEKLGYPKEWCYCGTYHIQIWYYCSTYHIKVWYYWGTYRDVPYQISLVAPSSLLDLSLQCPVSLERVPASVWQLHSQEQTDSCHWWYRWEEDGRSNSLHWPLQYVRHCFPPAVTRLSYMDDTHTFSNQYSSDLAISYINFS